MQGETWSTLQIRQLGPVVTGRTPASSNPDHFGEDIPFLTPTDMDGKRRIEKPSRFLSSKGAQALQRLIVQNAVAVSCIGWQLGKVILIDEPSVTNQQINSILVNPEIIDRLFLYYSLLLKRDEIFRLASGGSRTPIINKSVFEAIPIRVPSKKLQEAIAITLGGLDDKIEANSRMNQTLEIMARAIFKSWFVDFEPSSGSDDWQVVDVYRMASVTYGAPFSSTLFNEKGEGRPLIRIRDLTTQSPSIYTTEEHPKGKLVVPGEILAGMDGEFRAQIWCGPSGWLNQRVCCFEPNLGIPRAFLLFSIEKPLAYFEQSKTGTTVIHLGKADIDTFRFLLPTPEILEKFDGLTDPMLERIVANEQESRTLAALRDTLLPKLLSGEIRVKQAEKIVGEVT